MTGAKALIQALEKEDTDIVFGLPGGANLPIYDALVGANLRHVLVRHEQSAAHMADGYARIKRKAGVCFATSGPGATNLITGIATAYADSSPIVAVTGQVPLAMIGKDAFQETDIIGVANPCTKYSFQPGAAVEIPVVTTFKGKGSFPENHPLAMGPIGMHGHAEANKIILEADCILAVGARFSDRSVGKYDEFGKGMNIIHMDIDPAEIGKNKSVDVALVGDVKSSLKTLVKMLSKKMAKRSSDNPWLKRRKELIQYFAETLKDYPREITAKKSLKKLRELLPANAIVTTEVGQCQMWASLHFDVITPGTFFSSTGLGTMGFGFPASIGAKAARPNVPVVDIAGDGSFNMTENSLAVSVLEKLPVIVFLMNNC